MTIGWTEASAPALAMWLFPRLTARPGPGCVLLFAGLACILVVGAHAGIGRDAPKTADNPCDRRISTTKRWQRSGGQVKPRVNK